MKSTIWSSKSPPFARVCSVFGSLEARNVLACEAFAEASVSAESLRAALQELGVELREGSEVRAVVRYSLVQRLSWRCRWLLLKACGAFGAGCFWGLAGLAAGICMGGVAAVPSRAWPDVQVGDEPTVLAIIKAAYLCGVLLYYGMQRLDLVLIGLKLGSVLGVAYGFLRGLSVVHPEQHGFRSVFWAGLTGFWRTETHYPREKRTWDLPVFCNSYASFIIFNSFFRF